MAENMANRSMRMYGDEKGEKREKCECRVRELTGKEQQHSTHILDIQSTIQASASGGRDIYENGEHRYARSGGSSMTKYLSRSMSEYKSK